MTPTAASHREVAFEIHLPQIVRSRMLEALHVGLSRTAVYIQQALTTQDRRDRAGRRNVRDLQIQQPPTQLPTAPRRMLATQRQHPLFRRTVDLTRRNLRPTRLIQQPRATLSRRPRQPLVTRLPAHAESTTQLTHIRPFRRGQRHKLHSLRHHAHIFPRHRPKTSSNLLKKVRQA